MKNPRNLIILLLVALVVVVGFLYIRDSSFNKQSESHSEEEFKRGAHQGRLLEKGDFQVEVTIVEGSSPRFRIYFYKNGQSIQPSEVQFEMELERINRVEKIPFKENGDYLESSVEASEPHSFKVKITAVFEGKTFHWEYDSYEGRVELTPATLEANHIKIEKAGPVDLEIKLSVMGKIVPNEEVTVVISPRFAGMVKAVDKQLGDYVEKGETLAVIESNESLRNYEVKSEIAGMIIKKNINLGMYLTGQENIFVISDMHSVWADFNIYRQDLSRVKRGDPIQVTTLDGSIKQPSTLSYISPLGHENTQSITVRSLLSNPEGVWKPGLFVSGEITLEKIPVKVAVKEGALQKFRGWDVVFIDVNNLFEVVPVQLGARNKEWVEIKSGISAGEQYVAENSFILKADLEKSGAAHEH